MDTSKITSKGQVTIPKEVRDLMGLKCGDKLEFVKKGDKMTIRRVVPGQNPFLKFRGMDGGYFKSVEEINAWVADMRDDEDGPRH